MSKRGKIAKAWKEVVKKLESLNEEANALELKAKKLGPEDEMWVRNNLANWARKTGRDPAYERRKLMSHQAELDDDLPF